MKHRHTKYLLSFIPLLVLLSSCGLFSGNTKPTAEDSMQYHPPAPGLIDKNEFTRLYAELSSLADTNLQLGNFNGSILFAKDGNVIYEKYTGLKNLKGEDSIDATTPIHIASTTKTFTAIAILQLIQEGKLFLADSLQKFFPEFPYAGVTIHMLLSHRSGLPNYLYFMSDSKWDKNRTVFNADVLEYLIQEKPGVDFQPGTRFSYSNTNYVLLATIIEKITGKTFPEYLKQKLFTRLQMNNTFVYSQIDSARGVMSYSASGNPWQPDIFDATYGDKNIYSTPRDLLKWDQALYTDQIINKSLLDSAFTPYSFERPSIHNYGLGWRMMLLPNGKKIIYHNGRWHGFTSSFARLTDEKATIIILSNRQTRLSYHLAYKAYNVFGPYFPTQKMEENEAEVNSSAEKEPAPKIKKLTLSKRKKR